MKLLKMHQIIVQLSWIFYRLCYHPICSSLFPSCPYLDSIIPL